MDRDGTVSRSAHHLTDTIMTRIQVPALRQQQRGQQCPSQAGWGRGLFMLARAKGSDASAADIFGARPTDE